MASLDKELKRTYIYIIYNIYSLVFIRIFRRF